MFMVLGAAANDSPFDPASGEASTSRRATLSRPFRS
jgi:hypothetical protein